MAKRTRISFDVCRSMQDVFLHTKPCAILMAIRNNDGCSISKIYKNCEEIDTMYGYVMTIVHAFRDSGLVTTNTVGRTQEVSLTDKGREIALLLININKTLQ